MMSPESCSSASPFSALTYQEQQDRWLEWRSRQLDYRPADAGAQSELAAPESANKKGTANAAVPELPQPRIPGMAMAAPAGHRELSQVLSRHSQAARRAGAYQTTSLDRKASPGTSESPANAESRR